MVLGSSPLLSLSAVSKSLTREGPRSMIASSVQYI